MILIDKLAYNSAIRHKSPFLKGAFAIGSLCICVSSRTFTISAIILIMMMGATLLYSKTSGEHYRKLMLAPFSFLLIGSIAIIVNISPEPIGFINVPIGSSYLIITISRLIYGIRLILVSLASVSCLYFLILTTPMMDILHMLKKMKCPDLIIELMMMTYRYIFVLMDMAVAIMTAQNCRLANENAKTAIKGFGGMLSVLLIRAMQKARLLYDAMESRCYDGTLNVLCETYRAETKEKIWVGTILGALLILAIAIEIYKI